MPIIFSTPSSQSILMLEKDATFMLEAMKTSGNVPGALFPEAVAEALKSLNDRLSLESSDKLDIENESSPHSDDEDFVGINTKAFPLIELLERAIDQNEKLLWEKG